MEKHEMEEHDLTNRDYITAASKAFLLSIGVVIPFLAPVFLVDCYRNFLSRLNAPPPVVQTVQPTEQSPTIDEIANRVTHAPKQSPIEQAAGWQHGMLGANPDYSPKVATYSISVDK